MLTGRVTGLTALAVSALGQLRSVDTGRSITIGFAIPDVDKGPFDVIVVISASADAEWAGVAWGSGTGAPLSVVQPDGKSTIDTLQWTGYVYLAALHEHNNVTLSSRGDSVQIPYNGPSLFVFPTTRASEDGWTVTFLCQGCSEWADGSLDPNGQSELSFVMSTRPLYNGADSGAGYYERGSLTVDLDAAKLSDEEWDLLVGSLLGGKDEGLGRGSGDDGLDVGNGAEQELRRRQDDNGPIHVIIIGDDEEADPTGETEGEPTGEVEEEPTEDVGKPIDEVGEPEEDFEEPEEPEENGEGANDETEDGEDFGEEPTDIIEEEDPEPTDDSEEGEDGSEPNREPTETVDEEEEPTKAIDDGGTEPTESVEEGGEETEPEPEPTEIVDEGDQEEEEDGGIEMEESSLVLVPDDPIPTGDVPNSPSPSSPPTPTPSLVPDDPIVDV